jgi:glycine betaine/proline transport system permease protein
MQTTPASGYLVPVVMLCGIGDAPGVIVTIVFALPPLVRRTHLGIRQVRPDLVEAACAYDSSPRQLLSRVQLPLAMPSIMAGIDQSLMLSLSMVVITSLIAVGGLDQMVLRGIGRLDMGLATVGGIGIVLLAITLGRLTQAMGQPRRGVRHWCQTGPAGFILRPGRDVVWLQVPYAANPQKANTRLADGSDYGFSVNTTRIVVNRAWADKNPAAVKLFEVMRLPIADIARHTAGWIKFHQQLFDGWIAQALAASTGDRR